MAARPTQDARVLSHGRGGAGKLCPHHILQATLERLQWRAAVLLLLTQVCQATSPEMTRPPTTPSPKT
ncbi:hypothetical protein BDU57DRAFT_520128 [Ampelomyces quisqualis]|uniref:Uncharacterized protein n=1 Tax=Ampelomyces quisqualis TaxID=50730 RepID=A0A6A5QHT4_AMPQU|nr:hypothetical protein BDU57DRAFT_520128 [Ampelomyces quisqualis]